MYYDCYTGHFFQECFQSLKHCFGDQSQSKVTVFRWFWHFVSGASTLEDDDRCGRMATTFTPENVSKVKSLIKKDPKTAYAEILGIMKVSSGSRRCGSSQMRTHLWNSKETEVLPNKWLRVSLQNWATLPPYRLRTERRLRLTGMSTTVRLKSSMHSVNGIPERGACGLLLHHDNTSANTAAVTLDFLTASDIQLVTRSPYSPDLAPCDWFLLHSVKWQLAG